MTAPAHPTHLGRYELVRVLGRGAMGVVYEARDPRLNRPVAIKTILKGHLLDAELARDYSERFVREAQAVARLSHPHIVAVFDFGEEDDAAYIVMEFVRGRELASHFEAGEFFGLAAAVRIVCELLDALGYAHEHGIVHRDVKPANVMLDAAGRVKLTDFGVARMADGGADRTMPGTMVGTPSYMSPEQIQGLAVGSRTDLFAVGVVLYQFLAHCKPFAGGGHWTVQKKIVGEEPSPPSHVRAGVPPAFDGIVARALAKRPDDRYPNAAAFAAELRRALADAPSEAPAPRAADDGDATRVVPVRPSGTRAMGNTAAAPAATSPGRTPATWPGDTARDGDAATHLSLPMAGGTTAVPTSPRTAARIDAHSHADDATRRMRPPDASGAAPARGAAAPAAAGDATLLLPGHPAATPQPMPAGAPPPGDRDATLAPPRAQGADGRGTAWLPHRVDTPEAGSAACAPTPTAEAADALLPERSRTASAAMPSRPDGAPAQHGMAAGTSAPARRGAAPWLIGGGAIGAAALAVGIALLRPGGRDTAPALAPAASVPRPLPAAPSPTVPAAPPAAAPTVPVPETVPMPTPVPDTSSAPSSPSPSASSVSPPTRTTAPQAGPAAPPTLARGAASTPQRLPDVAAPPARTASRSGRPPAAAPAPPAVASTHAEPRPAPRPAPAPRPNRAHCSDLLQRLQLGETLGPEQTEILRRECRP